MSTAFSFAASSPSLASSFRSSNLRNTANAGYTAVELDVPLDTRFFAALFATPAPFSTRDHSSGRGGRSSGNGSIKRRMRSASAASFPTPPPPPPFLLFFFEDAPPGGLGRVTCWVRYGR